MAGPGTNPCHTPSTPQPQPAAPLSRSGQRVERAAHRDPVGDGATTAIPAASGKCSFLGPIGVTNQQFQKYVNTPADLLAVELVPADPAQLRRYCVPDDRGDSAVVLRLDDPPRARPCARRPEKRYRGSQDSAVPVRRFYADES